MFTVEQRDALQERILRLAHGDERVVAAAAVGSLAMDEGDRFSDLDLTFAITDHVPVGDVLDDWKRTLVRELDAVHLLDTRRDPTTYRVFLLPGELQCDISMTPATRFRPAGPRFRMLFGEMADGEPEVASPPVDAGPGAAADMFGWGVVYALHARACIGRGRMWQAEHYVGVVRDTALSLACMRLGLPATQARGYDDLPAEMLARLAEARVEAAGHAALTRALGASVRALMREGTEALLPGAEVVAKRLVDLC